MTETSYLHKAWEFLTLTLFLLLRILSDTLSYRLFTEEDTLSETGANQVRRTSASAMHLIRHRLSPHIAKRLAVTRFVV